MFQSTAAIAGSGFMGAAHLEALRRLGIEVSGIASSSHDKATDAAKQMGLSKGYTSYEELLADDTVDVVHICTPNMLHFDMAKRALKVGKHVICEKPLAMNSVESGELSALAQSSGLKAGVCYNLRYYPLNFHARDLVASDELGRLFHINGCYIQDWLQFDTDFNWRVDSKKGGALRSVADIGTHWMDMVQMITGQKIARVFADLSTVFQTRTSDSNTRVPVDTEDCASILFRMQNGVAGSFFVSQVASGRKNTIRYEISGEKGAVAWDSETPNDLWLGYRDRPNQILNKDPALMSANAAALANYPGGHNEGYPDTFKQCFRSFYEAVEATSGPAPWQFPTFEDGHREILLCEAILKSHQQESWVAVEQP